MLSRRALSPYSVARLIVAPTMSPQDSTETSVISERCVPKDPLSEEWWNKSGKQHHAKWLRLRCGHAPPRWPHWARPKLGTSALCRANDFLPAAEPCSRGSFEGQHI